MGWGGVGAVGRGAGLGYAVGRAIQRLWRDGDSGGARERGSEVATVTQGRQWVKQKTSPEWSFW